MARHRRLAALLLLGLASRTWAGLAEPPVLDCGLAADTVVLTASAKLDPACVWTGIEIVASDVTLDCQGAHLSPGANRRYGILVTAPTDTAIANVAIRNCHVDGFLNDVRITREGFRDLAEGEEYDHAFANILLEDSTITNSRGVGVFVDGYVTGVTLRRLHVEGTGSAGIYLEAGSKDNVVADNTIVGNGYSENGPDGQLFEVNGATFWFWGTGREGLAIDGSRSNLVAGNTFAGNAAGGIFLYKNCGEFVNQRPERWWHRRYGADDNVIEDNTFVGGETGVWIGSRMGENTFPMDCSDPPYQFGVVRDFAKRNVVRGNVFDGVTFGVRVEDDDNVVTDNDFTSDDPTHQAVVVGTRFRTFALDEPVAGTTVNGNRATIADVQNPYRWIHGHAATTADGNQSFGRPVGLCEGAPLPTHPFVFAVAVVPADPDDPPTGGPPPVPPLEPLPPCPLACDVTSPAIRTALGIRRVGPPLGDEGFVLRGRVLLAWPFDPALDPATTGVGVLVESDAGLRVVDAVVPGGAFDAVARVGWKTSARGDAWKWIGLPDGAPGGITRLTVKDRSDRTPGLVSFSVRGPRGSYEIDPAFLRLHGFVSLDPPTAETGQCMVFDFTSATGCRVTDHAVACR